MKNFSYIKDKKTSKYTENTTHEYSHAIDALGYAYSDIYVNNRLGSFDKKLLGPLRHGKVLNPFRLKKSIDLGSALSI